MAEGRQVSVVLVEDVEEFGEVLHPAEDLFGLPDVGFIQDYDHRQLTLVEDRAGEQHVTHEGVRIPAASQINDVDQDCRKSCCKGGRDDLPGGGPGEGFDLAWGVDEDELRFVALLIDDLDHLDHLSRKQVKRSHDRPIRSQLILLHHPPVVELLPDIDPRCEGHLLTRRVQVDQERREVLAITLEGLSVETLHEGGLAGAGHTDDDQAGFLLSRWFRKIHSHHFLHCLLFFWCLVLFLHFL